MMQDSSGVGNGGDRHHDAFTTWLPGAGIRSGLALGRIDDSGLQTIEDKVHVHDLHATILHVFEFDHKRMTYRVQGREFRLTDVGAEVVAKLSA